jgi:hypothetical protein
MARAMSITPAKTNFRDVSGVPRAMDANPQSGRTNTTTDLSSMLYPIAVRRTPGHDQTL